MYDENLLLHLMGEPTRPEADTPCPHAGVAAPHGARPLAMVYSPEQEWRDLYESEMGHERGTIFKELDFPFFGGEAHD